jgi:arsenite methyltransferase
LAHIVSSQCLQELTMNPSSLTDDIRARYSEAARNARNGATASCCGSGSAAVCCDPISSDLYGDAEGAAVPALALRASLGCGNPTALAELKPGETVLDLGSGGGIDVLLSARRVGPTGKAFGLDMTDEMLAVAEENRRQSGLANVEFLRGEIERIPLPDRSVDVIISNCVINLSTDKPRALREAFRVLKPGGRFAVSDVVVRGTMPDAIRRDARAWAGCVAGALEEQEYLALLAAAGFTGATIEVTRAFGAADARAFLAGVDVPGSADLDGVFVSAFVRATRPAEACCGPQCCH